MYLENRGKLDYCQMNGFVVGIHSYIFLERENTESYLESLILIYYLHDINIIVGHEEVHTLYVRLFSMMQPMFQ